MSEGRELRLSWVQKARRLWQPRHAAFWMMLALNAASSILVWVSQTYPLAPWARLVVFGFAVGNFWLGIRYAKVLIASPPPSQ